MSSKKPVSRLREVIQAPKRVSLIEFVLFFMEYFVVGSFVEDIAGLVFSLCVFVFGLKLNE